MKKFGIYNYINNSAKSPTDDNMAMKLLLNLMASKNANNYPNNDVPMDENQNDNNDEQQSQNTEPIISPLMQKEYDAKTNSYINLYPHPKT